MQHRSAQGQIIRLRKVKLVGSQRAGRNQSRQRHQPLNKTAHRQNNIRRAHIQLFGDAHSQHRRRRKRVVVFVVRDNRHHQNARARVDCEHSVGDAHLRGDIAAARGKTITARRIAAGNINFRHRHRPFRHLRARADNAHCQRRRVNDINRHRRAHCQRRRRAVRRLNINIINARRRRRDAAQRAR